MKIYGLAVFGVVFLCSVRAMATLPPDADMQHQQILQYRQRAMAEYETQQKALGQERIESRKRVLVAMERPPWVGARSNPVKASGIGSLSAESGKSSESKPHRFLVSFVLIILLLAVAGWVRYATKDVD